MNVGVGVVFGLAAAVLQSASYIFSRRFMRRGGVSAFHLLAVSHTLMGAMSVVILPFVWSRACPPLSAYWRPLIAAAGFYVVAQLSLFAALARVDASRVSPMLGVKVILLALLTTLIFGTPLGWLQWAAVIMTAASAFLLNETGGRMPLKAVAGVAGAVSGYAVSDMSIRQLVDALAPAGASAPLLGSCLAYALCGAAGLAVLAWRGWPARGVWADVAPQAVTWFAGMCFLFAAIGGIGVVFAVIAQSTRGVISVAMGVALARAGFVHLEQHAPRRVVVKRLAAALLMFGALVLYSLAGG